ncbi:TPA: hypothetical protein I6Y62_004328 [Vibrio parahaemolyticus]|nr:hypothetical protein [Vibrio parahaemolyticus]HAS3062113.1 hypothetical protein [Vibrio parahaemolyticus]
MIDGQGRVTVERVVRQVVRLKQGQQVAVIERPGPIRFSVVRGGIQGPVGTVAEEVLNRAEAAERTANEAKKLAQDNHNAVDLMLDEMTAAFEFQTGIINGISQ